jgi:pyridoxine 5'-phosphate synthase PdxJ
VIAQNKEDGRRTSDQPEIIALRGVLQRGRLAVLVLAGHEGVAEINMEVRPVSQHVRKADLVQFRQAVAIQVGIGLHREGERRAGRTRSVKCAISLDRQ